MLKYTFVFILIGLLFVEVYSLADVIQEIKKNKYPAEAHEVITEDGYITVLHRIPHGKNNYTTDCVVLLVHGLASSSADYVNAGPGKSLSYILADSGCDVWMTNARGNSYSTKHVRLNSKENAQQFYNFSFHEIGKLDLPAQIDYVLNVTSVKKLFYIGHSQGGTVLYVLLSERPEYNKKIRLASLMAPGAVANHTASYLLLLSKGIYQEEDLCNDLHIYSLPFPEFIRESVSTLCSIETNRLLCKGLYAALLGSELQEINSTLIPIIFKSFPSDFPMKTLFHYGQIAKEGVFQKYSYRKEGNLKAYGTEYPPPYNFTAITAAIAIYYGGNDILAAAKDVVAAARLLPNVVKKYLIPTYGHVDFAYAITAPVFYKVLINFMKTF